jgi:hypothetical protein
MRSWISNPRIFSKILPIPEKRRVHVLIWSLPATAVYWSCQFIARPSNVSLKHWQRMGGASIDENMLIDKTIHNTINYKSSVLKVCLRTTCTVSPFICFTRNIFFLSSMSVHL